MASFTSTTSMTLPMPLMSVETRGQEELVGGIQLDWEEREGPTDLMLDILCTRSPTGRRRMFLRRYRL